MERPRQNGRFYLKNEQRWFKDGTCLFRLAPRTKKRERNGPRVVEKKRKESERGGT